MAKPYRVGRSRKRDKPVRPIVYEKKTVISNLRPVEALYLLNKAGKEKMTIQNSLECVLAYLTVNNYISYTNHRLVTLNHPNIKDLRNYERSCLGEIHHQRQSLLLDILYRVQFKNIAEAQGFVSIQKVGLMFMGGRMNLLDRFYQAIEELMELKDKFIELKEHNDDRYLIAMSYAFPSHEINTNNNSYGKTLKMIEESALIRSSSMGGPLIETV